MADPSDIPVYPFDDTGTAETNFIKAEQHTLSAVNDAAYNIIVPDFAPFYLHNLKLVHVDQAGNKTPLNDVVDYYPALPYMAATRSVGQFVYGGFAILNRGLSGTIEIDYQTVGDKWTADKNHVYSALLEVVYNARTTWWDSITNVQDLFPPALHTNNAGDIAGHDSIIAKLEEIRQAIITTTVQVPTFFLEHVMETNAHNVSRAELGVEKLPNIRLATEQEVNTKKSVEALITLEQALRIFMTK